MLIFPILLATLTAAIGWLFQNQSARIANDRKLRDAELQRAQAIFEEVSNSMDGLYYYLRHGAMYVAVRQALGGEESQARAEDDQETWDAYEEAVLVWMRNKTRFVAQMRRYFGNKNCQRLEAIQEAFRKAGAMVGSTYYRRRHSVVKDGKVDAGAYYALLDPLEDDLLTLSEQMIRQIQNENVGRLRQQRSSLLDRIR